MFHVPVISVDRVPLMPTTLLRARRWIETKKATPFWNKGIFCVRLNQEPSDTKKQQMVLGIDPGSKKEGYTLKTRKRTLLNIQADAVTWVKDAIKTRKNARRTRRQRKTPYRQCRLNRSRGGIPPSTKARWQWKLRILNWLSKMFPVSDVIVEDIKAKTKEGQKGWNKSFSPLQVGKNWFYGEIKKSYDLHTKQGHQTKTLRDHFGLSKSNKKMSRGFDAHCVDSWVLANSVVEGHNRPDNQNILFIRPLKFHRRQLHVFNPTIGGKRRFYGGTRSMGLKRGSLVLHSKYGHCHVGGTSSGRISLHKKGTNKRLCLNSKVGECVFISFPNWTFSW
jgi:hypothetical protein